MEDETSARSQAWKDVVEACTCRFLSRMHSPYSPRPRSWAQTIAFLITATLFLEIVRTTLFCVANADGVLSFLYPARIALSASNTPCYDDLLSSIPRSAVITFDASTLNIVPERTTPFDVSFPLCATRPLTVVVDYMSREVRRSDASKRIDRTILSVRPSVTKGWKAAKRGSFSLALTPRGFFIDGENASAFFWELFGDEENDSKDVSPAFGSLFVLGEFCERQRPTTESPTDVYVCTRASVADAMRRIRSTRETRALLHFALRYAFYDLIWSVTFAVRLAEILLDIVVPSVCAYVLLWFSIRRRSLERIRNALYQVPVIKSMIYASFRTFLCFFLLFPEFTCFGLTRLCFSARGRQVVLVVFRRFGRVVTVSRWSFSCVATRIHACTVDPLRAFVHH